MEAVTGVRLSFWRAAVVFRIVSALFCCYLIFRWRHLYAHLPVAVAVGLAIAAVTAVVAVLGLTGRANHGWLVAADAAITIVLTGLTHWAQTPTQLHGGMTTLTTVWAAGPVIEAGLVFGWFGGLAVALAQFASTVVVRDGYDGNTVKNGVLLVIVGLISGYLMAWTASAETERAQLATLAERERLARSIHDGVLQVLGLVHRKAAAAGGDWAELGRAAAEQEAALRALVTSRPSLAGVAGLDGPARLDGSSGPTSEAGPTSQAGQRDLIAELVALRSARVTVAVPGHPLPLAAGRVAELAAVVRAALHNVDRHAGPDAHSWVLAEELDGEVWITVRDDGVGFDAERLAEAESDGRLGVAASIRGRVADLGGTVRISSKPGAGTEIELMVPLAGGRRRGR